MIDLPIDAIERCLVAGMWVTDAQLVEATAQFIALKAGNERLQIENKLGKTLRDSIFTYFDNRHDPYVSQQDQTAMRYKVVLAMEAFDDVYEEETQ